MQTGFDMEKEIINTDRGTFEVCPIELIRFKIQDRSINPRLPERILVDVVKEKAREEMCSEFDEELVSLGKKKRLMRALVDGLPKRIKVWEFFFCVEGEYKKIEGDGDE